jgi:Cu-Zn family superoxide dismutase
MRLLPLSLVLLTSVAASGCAATTEVADASSGTTTDTLATGTLHKADGVTVGSVRLTGSAESKTLIVDVNGMAPGTYGAHIHAVGLCEGPAFTSAAAHWNPTARQHGRLNPQGTHHGDLPNLVVGADGRGSLQFAVPGALAGPDGLFDADGASVVIHAGPDDEHTDPSGNSGARIACAVLNR